MSNVPYLNHNQQYVMVLLHRWVLQISWEITQYQPNFRPGKPVEALSLRNQVFLWPQFNFYLPAHSCTYRTSHHGSSQGYRRGIQPEKVALASGVGLGRAAILTYTFLKYTLSLCTKVYLILGVCTKVYLKNLATLDADTKVYLE